MNLKKLYIFSLSSVLNSRVSLLLFLHTYLIPYRTRPHYSAAFTHYLPFTLLPPFISFHIFLAPNISVSFIIHPLTIPYMYSLITRITSLHHIKYSLSKTRVSLLYGSENLFLFSFLPTKDSILTLSRVLT